MTKPPTRSLRLLHTSDCHLGTDGEGEEADAFAWAIALAAEEAVDAVLISGDLFDRSRVSDDVVAWAAAKLGMLHCPVVVITGNHDLHGTRSPQQRLREACGRHVRFLDDPCGSMIELAELDLAVWGRSMEAHLPSFRPLGNLPERPDRGWAVVMAHGLVMDDDRASLRSSPIYPHELDRIDWDYVALGHIHRHQVIRESPVPVRYCGATATADAGRPAVVIVDLEPGSPVTARLVTKLRV
jgi:exonuclease SbcD